MNISLGTWTLLNTGIYQSKTLILNNQASLAPFDAELLVKTQSEVEKVIKVNPSDKTSASGR